ncbi:MAG: class I SAM-dependent methyltransferase [Acidobacteriota bacterium]|nr:class I SAM-dependent methyltransferase [Acidobacteriota bacterium]
MKAGNSQVTAAVQSLVSDLATLGWYHSMELPTGEVIPGLQTIEQLKARLAQFPIPQDLAGKRVLDIGAWDGWFTFEMERRGASVVAVDLSPNTRFLKARDLMGSQAEYHIMDVLDLSPERLGLFDIVLFFGVLYHLKHPLLALERVCAMSTDLVLVESYVSDSSVADPVPRMEFYEFDELCGQFDNWVGPNTACLLAWCRTAGFARVSLNSVIDNRAHVTCCRRWNAVNGLRSASPFPVAVQNATSLDHSFSSTKDEYVSIWFETPEKELRLDDVFPEVSSFGSRPVAVTASGGNGWLANFKLPLGLTKGWHNVTLRIRDSLPGKAVQIGIDDPEPEVWNKANNGNPRIVVVADNNTWERDKVRVGPESCVAVWVEGLAGQQPKREDVELRLSGNTLPAIFVSEPDAEGLVQVNARLPPGLTPGVRGLQVMCRGVLSAPVEVGLFS